MFGGKLAKKRLAEDVKYISDRYKLYMTETEYNNVTLNIKKSAFEGKYELAYEVKNEKVDMAMLVKHLEIEGFYVDKMDKNKIHVRWDKIHYGY